MGAAERLNDLERRSLDKLLTGEHPVLGCLRRQLAAAAVAGREQTAAGFVTRLTVPEGVPRLAVTRPFQILDVYGEIAGLSGETGFILFVEDGALARLECQTLDDAWPEHPRIERLFFMHPRSLGSAELVETPVRDLGWALGGVDGRDLDPPSRVPPGAGEAGAEDEEATMAILRSDERSPDETQDVSTVFPQAAGRGRKEPQVPPAPAPEPASGDGARGPERTISPRRTMALVTINAVLATVLGITLVALLMVARNRPPAPAEPASGLAGLLAGDPLLEALLTFAVAGAVGACLANLAGLFQQSREPGSLPVRQEVFFYLRPLVGALTALLVFFIAAAGVIAFSAGEAAASWGRLPSRMTYVALSLVTGFGAYEVLDRLRGVLRALFSR